MVPIKSIPKLIDAVTAAYCFAQEPGCKWFPDQREGITFCNEAVAFVASLMGYSLFIRPTKENPDGAKLANDIIDELASSGDWMTVPAAIAQLRANDGELVIAAEKNPSGHGHVCVLIPGEPEDSGHWAPVKAPKVINVGKDVFIGRGANWAFATVPTFYISKAVA